MPLAGIFHKFSRGEEIMWRFLEMTTEYLLNEQMEHVLSALTPSNRLVMRVCLHTGLRVGDVLAREQSSF